MTLFTEKGETKTYKEIEIENWNEFSKKCEASNKTILETNICSINNKKCKMQTCFLKTAAREIRNQKL
jgi:hypothetical protein